MSSVSRVILLPIFLVLAVGSTYAKDWTLANGKIVTGEFKSSKNAVVYLDNGNTLSFHRLRERDQNEIRRKLLLKNAKDALAAIKRPERPIRSFLHANGTRRMKGRMLGVTSSGDVLVEVGFDVYEFQLSQFSATDAKYIRSEARKAGDDGYLPKDNSDGAGGTEAPAAGNGQNRLGGGPMTGAAGGGGNAGGAIERGDGDPLASMPPSPEHGMERRGDEFDIRQFPNYPGGANNPFEQSPQSNAMGGLTKPGGFAPRPGSGPAVSGGAGAAAGDFAPKTNNLEGLDGVEFGREELPPIVIKPGDPGYDELKAEEDAKRRANEIFPMDRAPADGGQTPDTAPFSGLDEAHGNPPEQKPFSGGDAMPDDSSRTDDVTEPGATAAPGSSNSLAIGVLIGAGGMMLLLGGLGVGLLIGKQKK